jgi:hypothetical protein
MKHRECRDKRVNQGSPMISTIEAFLKTVTTNPSGRITFDFDAREYCFEDFQHSLRLEMTGSLTRTLERTGVLYIYGGSLEVNPMAVRVLENMHAAGKHLSEDAIRREIEMSRALYYSEHELEEMENV